MILSGGPNDDAMSVATTAANPGFNRRFGVIQNNDGIGFGAGYEHGRATNGNGIGIGNNNGASGAQGTTTMSIGNTDRRWKREQRQQQANPGSTRATAAADRWAEEQMFEEDVRAVLSMMRPNRRERLMGWKEYRTGGAHFRITVSWDEEFEPAMDGGGAPQTRVPNLADVLEAVLVGSALHDDDLLAAEEFDIYRGILKEVYRRLDDLQQCYE